jgi:hypothetical protein
VDPVDPVEPVDPEVLMVPGPLKLTETASVDVFSEPEPLSVKAPVAPAYVPVPPVIVAEPLAEPLPVRAETGSFMFPVSVPVEPLKVIVKGAVILPDESAAAIDMVELNVPLPTPLVNDAVPFSVTAVPVNGPLATTVTVVLIVSALASAVASAANALMIKTRLISGCLLRNTTPENNMEPAHPG